MDRWLALGAAALLAISGCVGPGIQTPATSDQTPARGSRRPPCDAAKEVARFMTVPKPELHKLDRSAGALTTPLKFLSTLFDGPNAWEDTGCSVSGIGRPVREGQHSTDGFYTVDVAVIDLVIEGVRVGPGRFVRLEILPGRPAHESAKRRRPAPADVIRFTGPLVWDKDKDAAHPRGHMEVHPITIEYLRGE